MPFSLLRRLRERSDWGGGPWVGNVAEIFPSAGKTSSSSLSISSSPLSRSGRWSGWGTLGAVRNEDVRKKLPGAGETSSAFSFISFLSLNVTGCWSNSGIWGDVRIEDVEKNLAEVGKSSSSSASSQTNLSTLSLDFFQDVFGMSVLFRKRLWIRQNKWSCYGRPHAESNNQRCLRTQAQEQSKEHQTPVKDIVSRCAELLPQAYRLR